MTAAKQTLEQLKQRVSSLEEEIIRLKDVEKELCDSKELNHTIFFNISCTVFLTDDHGKFLFISPNVADTFGYSPIEVETLGNISKLLGINFFPRNDLGEHGESRNVELQVTDKLGQGRHFFVNVKRVSLKEATFQYSCRDITDHKKAIEMADENEKRYEKLLDSVTDYTYTVNIEDGKPTSTTHSASCQAVTGYSADEYKADPYLWHNMILEEDRSTVTEKINTLITGKRSDPFEHRILHKDGAVRWVKTTPVPCVDEHGRLIAYDSLVTDITELKESELQESRMRHRLEAQWKIASLKDADLQTICDHLLSQMVEITESWYGFYGFFNEDEMILTIYSWSKGVMSDCAMHDKPIRFPLDESGLWGEVIRKKKPLIINDYHKEHAGKKGFPEGHVPLTRLMVLPVFSRDKIVAIGAVANKAFDYSDYDLKSTSTLLSNVHVLLERQEVNEELLKKNRALKALSKCNEALIRSTKESDLLREICKILVKTGNYPLAWVGVKKDDTEKTIFPLVQFGDASGYLEDIRISWADNEYGRGPTGMAVRTGKTQVLKDIALDETYFLWKDQARKRGYASSIALPLRTKNKCWGTLNVYATKPDAFDPEEIELLQELADNVSFGVTAIRTRAKQKTAETALRESQARMQAIYETVQTGIVIIDGENRQIIDANPVAAKMMGLTKKELIGKTCNEIFCIPPGGICPVLDLGKTAENAERHLVKTNGEKTPILKSVVKFNLNGRKCLLESFLDITALKQAEKEKGEMQAQIRQMQKMEAIGTLAGGIAHDFNNILTPIFAFTQMLQEDQAPESQAYQDLGDIRTSALRAKDLVSQILTFSREKEHELSPVKISPIVKESIKLLEASFPATIKIELRVIAKDDVVMADPTQIHQILMNLCTNALHAMMESGGVLEVRLEEKDRNHTSSRRYLALTVCDTGCGMDKFTQERIFEPYFTTKDVGEGTGLGLSVVHGIVRSFGGDIIVSSELGKGTTFTVYLPLVDQKAVETLHDQETECPKGYERILLVDDELAIVKSMGRILQSLGYKVTERTSSIEALEVFRVKPQEFDLVITDFTMPNMTGDRLAQ
ncbi:MAG: GAF domain-containing protein [Desulfobulbaceae bacterium]|uniref:histidine kinase n=1 Tax=Candidatus Desulfobia pelagia TaxID=2841692 RepID=A0A8J6TGH7_9BACT|nr:GAF domain-containing protein [Candidatus Desulfobia pelagia]